MLTSALRLLPLAVIRAPILWRATTSRGQARSDDEHLLAAADWLLEAQRAVDGGGYAHSFHLLRGWQPAYPETTGYILPTLCAVAARTDRGVYRDSVGAAVRWLRSIQAADGSFADLSGRPQVFDTGQILIGFNGLLVNAPDLANLGTARRAALWLCAMQEPDGSFVRGAYNGIPHSYYTRVGAALAVAGRLLADDRIREAGLNNLRWTVAQQQANGFFRHLSFDASPPYLHTMVYVIEGLLDGYDETAEAALFDAAWTFAEKLREVTRRDGILRSQYKADYGVANAGKCLTGLAQWAAVAFRLSRHLKDAAWYRTGSAVLEFVKSQQFFCRDARLRGGLPGSDPIWGSYMRASLPNWGVKFFIDAINEKQKSGAVLQ